MAFKLVEKYEKLRQWCERSAISITQLLISSMGVDPKFLQCLNHRIHQLVEWRNVGSAHASSPIIPDAGRIRDHSRTTSPSVAIAPEQDIRYNAYPACRTLTYPQM